MNFGIVSMAAVRICSVTNRLDLVAIRAWNFLETGSKLRRKHVTNRRGLWGRIAKVFQLTPWPLQVPAA